jgi:hypothetical protein
MTGSRSKTKDYLGKPLVLALLAAVALGVALGAVQAVNLEKGSLEALAAQLSRAYSSADSRSGLFLDAVLKNGGHLLLIWLAAFMPMGEWAAPGVLFVKAMGYGFTAGAIARSHEAGYAYPGPGVGATGAIVLGAGLFLCLMNIRYRRRSMRRPRGPKLGSELMEHVLMLLTAESLAVLAAML